MNAYTRAQIIDLWKDFYLKTVYGSVFNSKFLNMRFKSAKARYLTAQINLSQKSIK